MKPKKSPKIFSCYNDYQERPFGLKWGTAYAMDELVKGIKSNQAEALFQRIEMTGQMSEEIDACLLQAFRTGCEVSVQLYRRDAWGRLKAPCCGVFFGQADQEGFFLNNEKIFWEEVCQVTLQPQEKWFLVEDCIKDFNVSKQVAADAIVYERDEFYQPFYEEE